MLDREEQYWINRAKDEVKYTDAEALKTYKELEQYYAKLEKELSNEIAYFYSKYGQDNIIEYSNLLQKMDKADIDMLYQDWEGFAKKYPQYAHLTPVRENIYKLNRYEYLVEKARYNTTDLAVKETDILGAKLKSTAKEVYKKSSKTLSGNISLLTDSEADRLVNTRWIGGRNYSDSIWQNKQKLLGHLDYEFRNGIIRGDSYDEMIKKLKLTMDTSKFNAERLVKTEMSYTSNSASLQSYKDLGVRYYEYSAIMDSRTTEKCSGLDNKILEIEKAVIGVNYPPLHVFCRSRGIPISDRRAKELNI